jgi:hypothetical protein
MPRTPTLSTSPPARRSQLLIAVVLAIFAAGIVVESAAAAPIEDYGSTFSCRYRTIAGVSPSAFDLKRIVVTPPTMFADEDAQTLGWRLIVRRIRHRYEDDSHKVTYWRSKIRTAVAYQGQAADFSRIVYLPPDLSKTSRWDHDYFTASLRLIWYAPDGSIERSLIHEFWSVYTYHDGRLVFHTWDPNCSGFWQEHADGPG